jgi:signal transduction histidine kinase
MAADEAKRAEYVERLQAESDRLNHLVENVLAYARLSRPGSRTDRETISVAELVDRTRDRLAARAERAEMHLAIEVDDGAAGTRVRANVSAVEQILTNLVDNACKYAARAEDRTIHLEAGRDGGTVTIVVRDHGPGVPATQARRLFRPFRKSAHEAARSAPGVGLGLALSRRLTRDMGGDLRLDDTVEDGARFVLSLPV